ncbi:MAG TPA: enoyl-CoA hydratase-related protein [Caulobacteraceae bacterium]|nr:enoyl-CoA hydratase-related protein [Caulobacteraceae bacterium]
MTDDVLIERDDGVLVITFNRPEKKNALTRAMYEAAANALEAAENDPLVRCVLFQGAGDCFTAGNDLGDFAAANRGDDGDRPRGGSGLIRALGRGTKPYVAAAHGVAIGVGATMLLHCELVFVADDARISTPFVNLALAPEAASSMLLPARIGHARAFAMFALGEPVLGDQAVAWGLANAAHPAAEVKGKALAAAKTLAKKPLGSLIITKRLMREGEKIMAQMDAEIGHFTERLKSAEAAEAFAAFRERRAPDFTKVA